MSDVNVRKHMGPDSRESMSSGCLTKLELNHAVSITVQILAK